VSLFDAETETDAETWNPFGEEFEVPASAGASDGKRRPAFDERTGRYCDLPPVPGYEKRRTWTRVTTLKETLEDRSLLEAWKRRQVLLGVKRETRLLGEIGPQLDPSTKFGRNKLNSLVDRAIDLAGSHEGRDKGSDLHALIEIDHADPINIDTLDDGSRAWFREYRRVLHEGEIKILPEYVERTVVIPEIGCAGTLDMIVSHRGLLRIGDLKSQKTLIFGQMGLCIQLACYSRASYMLDETSWTWKDMPQVEQDAGVIIWVPAIEPEQAAPKRVDLEFGWAMALQSFQTRKDRNRKGIVTDW